MPVMALYRSSEITPEQYAPYEAFIVSQPVPPGALYHTAAFDADGLCVVDIWESEAALQQFQAGAIAPTLAQFGLPVVTPKVLQVKAIATHDGIDPYKVLKPQLQPA
jgi:hypothetical protein